MKHIIFTFILSGFLCSLAFPGDEKGEKELQKAPDFTLKTMMGKSYTLSKNLGKGPIIINFWATWCIPCLAEMKAMKPMYKKYKEHGLTVLSITTDDTKTKSKVKGFVRSRKYPYTILMDSNKEVFNLLHASNMPHLFLLDKEGNIVYSHSGYRKGDEKELEEKLAALMTTSDK